MTLNTLTVCAAVTPTVFQTYVSHYLNRKPLRQKPTAHISYHEGLYLIRAFLYHASHHTVEELQAFTSQWVPHPAWVRVSTETIPSDISLKAAETLINQLGHKGVDKVGGRNWWQWRRKGDDLKAEWIEMRGDHNARKKKGLEAERIMMYVHGGAYFFGSVDEHRYQMQRHARKLRARVFAPRYRLAPQFPFPCGLQDCLAAYLYLLTVQKPSEIILCGDSAGGGMVVSVLVMLRDQGLPLPAGAVLISPWVDLTHSFPSVAGSSEYDYIPAHGFMQKPSAAWPPPNEDEIKEVVKAAILRHANKDIPLKPTTRDDGKSTEEEAVQGFAIHRDLLDSAEEAKSNPSNPADGSDDKAIAGNTIPGPGHHLSIRLGNSLVVVKDQIQMYSTNQLISHPLVSPVLQPSLGGLSPLLILTGGGEVLRDEQIYLAHKAANPAKYAPGEAYLDEYDPNRTLLHKHKPTDVQLQVWDDLCHVAPTLSFTRPAKFMYRSVAQFGAWALARAQQKGIEILDDDDVSVISSGSDTDTDSDDSSGKKKLKANHTRHGITGETAQIGKAGDPLPPFKNHMIRQQVDRNGIIFPLAPAHTLPALQMSASEVGVIKPGPVEKWLTAKKEWDVKYAKEKSTVQKLRIIEMKKGLEEYGVGENPPPSALAGRRSKGEVEASSLARKRKSYGMMLWSHWGGRHDESTIKREEEMLSQDAKASVPVVQIEPAQDEANAADRGDQVTSPNRSRRKSRVLGAGGEEKRSRSRRRTITVTDTGQTEGVDEGGEVERLRKDLVARHNAGLTKARSFYNEANLQREQEPDHTHLVPGYLPKNRDLMIPMKSSADSESIATRTTGASDMDSLGNMSTTAVFSAPVVMKKDRSANKAVPSDGDHAFTTRSEVGSIMTGWPDTPSSEQSLERLQTTQLEHEGPNSRSRSNIAVLGVAGVVGLAAESDNVSRCPSSSSSSLSAADGSQGQLQTQLKAQKQEGEKAGSTGENGEGEGGGNSSSSSSSSDSDVQQQARMPGSETYTPQAPVATKKEQHDATTNGDRTISMINSRTVIGESPRPIMYDRTDTRFHTAREQL